MSIHLATAKNDLVYATNAAMAATTTFVAIHLVQHATTHAPPVAANVSKISSL
jgi:hypothetical protein